MGHIRKRATDKFNKKIESAHNDNHLCGKHNGKLSELNENNAGVFQWLPLGGILYIIYADEVMNKYKINEQKEYKKTYAKIRKFDIEKNGRETC